MRLNKYNPKIPNKHDGQCPKDWLHPDYFLRVKVAIIPVCIEVTMPVPRYSLRLLSLGALYPFVYDTYDYEIPYHKTCETLVQLMPSSYVIQYSKNDKFMYVYCNEWIDSAILQLANDSTDKILTNVTFDRRRPTRPGRVQPNNRMLLSLVNKVKNEVH